MSRHADRFRRWFRPGGPARRALRFADPLHTLFSPVYRKELAVLSRRPGTYVLRAAYALVVLVIVSLAFFGASMQADFGSGADMLQRQSEVAPTLALTIGWIQFVVLTLTAPLLTSSCICDEKTRRTLPSLAATPLTATQIVFGKLASRMSQLLFLALLPLPILLFLRVYGGIEARVILMMTAITLGSATLSGAIGVMYSVWHRRPWTVIIIATLTLLLLYAIPPVAVGLIGIWWPGTAMFLASRFTFLSPPSIMAFVQFSSGGVTPLGIRVSAAVALCVGACLLASTLISLFAAATLRRVMLAEAGGPVTRRRALKAASASAADPPPIPQDRPRTSRQVGERPVLWRELHQPAMGGGITRNVVIGVFAFIVAIIYVRVGVIGHFSELYFHILAGLFFVLLSIMIAAVSTTHVIASERDARSFDVLLTTPLTAFSIVMGKYLPGLLRACIVPALLLAHVIVFSLLGYLHPMAILHVVLTLSGSIILLTGVGMYLSVACRTAMRASILNLMFGVFLWGGVPILLMLVVTFLSSTYYNMEGSAIFVAIFAINPFFFTASALEGMVYEPGGVLSYEMFSQIESPMEFTMWAFSGWFVQAVVGVAALFGAVARLAMSSARTR